MLRLISIFVVVFTAGCASNSVRIDTDQSTNFAQIKSYAVTSINPQDNLGADRLVNSLTDFLTQNGKLVGDPGFVDATIEIDHYEQQQPNQSRLSIGLGTGSYGRSGGIGVGGSVSVPWGDDMLLYAIVVMKVLVDDRLVWSASNSAEIDTDQPSGTGDAQLKALRGLLDVFPVDR
ncbi:hypothetical protein [Aliiglaciecola litoralis]|uniref:DUF4136 domain-containing protein n=1 Tax=Aliiglaciecola litoralis TaxID=582857 RepID=A0ABN1LTF1_9ALTE